MSEERVAWGRGSGGGSREAVMQRVGMIGPGKMGLPIARNLTERGFEVIGYRRHASPELAAAGGVPAVSAAEVAERADVLVSILPEAADVEEVACGPAGTLTTMRPGTVHIEMSTIDVDRKSRIRDAVRARGGDLLDCPISGSPGMIAPRLATTFAAGDLASVDIVAPVLDAISGPWFYTALFGTGARLKYIANMLVAVHTVAAAEAMVLARRSGLDLELVQRTLDNSIALSAIWKQRGPVMRERAWSPAPGPIGTLHPILEQIEEHAARVGAATPVFASAKSVFDVAVDDGWADLDIACVHDQLAGDRNPAVATGAGRRGAR
ncbi:MAG TPA: NAD(P)-dependent oxidoreductase [Streptosporangiaceae bacterium]